MLVIDAVGAAHRARHPALDDRAAVDGDRVDAQVVDRRVATRLVLGVGRRGLDRLGDDPGGLLRHEVEQADRVLDRLAADEVRDDAHLARRHRDSTNECTCLHELHFFRSPVWPWNVRVSENSPSLWPTICSVMNTGMNLRPLWIGEGEADHRRDDRRAARVGRDHAACRVRLLLAAAAIFFAR